MTGWAYVANIAAAVGGVASLVAVLIGVRALNDTHAARLGAARDRDRQRLELIAQHLDRMRKAALADKAQATERNDWQDGIGLLNRYLAASSLSLPKCREVAGKRSAVEVLEAMAAADAEITGVLGKLAEEGAADRQRRGGVRRTPLMRARRPPTSVNRTPPPRKLAGKSVRRRRLAAFLDSAPGAGWMVVIHR